MATRADAALANMQSVTGFSSNTSQADNIMKVLEQAGFSSGTMADRVRAYQAATFGLNGTYSDIMWNSGGIVSPPPDIAISELV